MPGTAPGPATRTAAPAALDAYGRGHADPQAEKVALDHLSRVHGARELHAVVLALILPADSSPALQRWQGETTGHAQAAWLLQQVRSLTPRTRLPCYEQLLIRVARLAPTQQLSLLRATRRVMNASGKARPLDRLHWLAMRHQLDAPAPAVLASRSRGIDELAPADLQAIAAYTAFLSRLVPLDEAENSVAGPDWYASALASMPSVDGQALTRQVPDSDALVHALRCLQALSWMQRPVLLRGWLSAAQQHSRPGRLGDSAADALRLSATLLDSPLPPPLAAHFSEMIWSRP